MSLSHLASRERLPQPSRGYTLRRLPRSSPADLTHAAVLPTVTLSLLPSVYLFRSLPPSLSPSPSRSASAAASVSAPRRVGAGGNTRSSCFPLARSRARSSPSFQLFVSYFVPHRLSALHSSLFPTIQLQPASLASSRDSPATEETTHVCALPLSRSHTTALLLIQRYFMQIPRHRIPFRSTMPRFSRKNHGIVCGFEFTFVKNTKTLIDTLSRTRKKDRRVTIKR